MKKLQGEKYQTIVKLPDGIEIKVNIHSWVLFIPPRNYYYLSSLEQVFDSLLEYRVKQLAINGVHKDIKNLKESIEKARDELIKIIQPLMTIKNIV